MKYLWDILRPAAVRESLFKGHWDIATDKYRRSKVYRLERSGMYVSMYVFICMCVYVCI
jgi:hypothetical protein